MVSKLRSKRYLLHASETTCPPAFDAFLQASGGKPRVFPPRRPPLQAHGARFVRSITAEALEPMVKLGERALYEGIPPYVRPSQAERQHQGRAHQRSAPEPGRGSASGPGRRREHVGGLRSDDARDAA